MRIDKYTQKMQEALQSEVRLGSVPPLRFMIDGAGSWRLREAMPGKLTSAVS